MGNADPSAKPPQKSRWDKLDIILKPVGGLLTALSVALVGFYGTRVLESGRAADANVRLYAELMSSRETSDSSLRQGMFNTIVSRFLSPGTNPRQSGDDSPSAVKARYEMNVLQLEILAYNFHDSLDLAPLFKDVYRKVARTAPSADVALGPEDRSALLKRLEWVAGEVISKQVAALDEVSNVVRQSFGLDRFDEAGGFIEKLIHKTLGYKDGSDTRYKAFSVDVISIDRKKKEIQVRLTVWKASGLDGVSDADPVVDVTFTVGFFDFPLVDNTRLGGGERCALVLTDFGDYEAHLSLVYFPGSRASLKEKQFYDDIVLELRRSQGLPTAQQQGEN